MTYNFSRISAILAVLATTSLPPSPASAGCLGPICWPDQGPIARQITPASKSNGVYFDMAKGMPAKMISGSGETNPEIIALGDAMYYEAKRYKDAEANPVKQLEARASVATTIFARADRDEEYGGSIVNVVYAYRYCLRENACDRAFRFGRNPPVTVRDGVTWRPIGQFSYIQMGEDLPWEDNAEEWKVFHQLAKRLYTEWKAKGPATVAPRAQYLVENCRFYYATYIKKPKWAYYMKKCGTIGEHHFYDPEPLPMAQAREANHILAYAPLPKPRPPVEALLAKAEEAKAMASDKAKAEAIVQANASNWTLNARWYSFIPEDKTGKLLSSLQ
ncbi:MAG TPA: hypothetical protein VHP58_00900 [Alphaproteobacteria bacterium]|nr:hypothetical protein [Alphaproteobacteria bacterium]